VQNSRNEPHSGPTLAKLRHYSIALPLVLLAFVSPLRAQDEVQARMQEWSKALGVTCSQCHLEGDFKAPYIPAFDMAYRMAQMVRSLNEGPLKSMGGVTCWTCHRGATIPPKITREQWEAASKPFEAAFNGDNSMALQMGVFTAALGVECTFCHDATNWGSDEKPQKATARRMRGMVGGINKHFAGVRNPEISCLACHQGQVKVRR
jgi:formate-dependent nitrite reductase cytochrome c552 subunit